MNNPAFRVVDSGLRTGRENIALDQAMVDAHHAGEIPDTLRFIHFKPCALLGRHQALRQEVHSDYCAAGRIEVGRRITGGGAIYFDEGQLGWALVCHRRALGGGSLADLTQRICEASAAGLSRLGVDARFRPRNDIEVEGRKISGTGGFFDGDTLIYQGTVLIDPNVEHMFSALNVARSKMQKRDLDAASARVTSLKALLGEAPDIAAVKAALGAGFADALGFDMRPGNLTEIEERRASEAFAEEIGTDAFVAEIDDPAREAGVLSGSHRGAGGEVSAHIRLEGPTNNRLREVLISGDFFVTPPRIIYDLEASLRGVEIINARSAVERFFQTADIGMVSAGPADFIAAIEAAVLSRAESA